MRQLLLLLVMGCSLSAWAQQYSATIEGIVRDEKDKPFAGVSVIILGKEKGIITNDSGRFTIKVAAEKAFAIVFSHTGYESLQKNFLLNKDETEKITVRLVKSSSTMETVVIADDRQRKESGLVKFNPKNALLLPSTSGGIEALIKTIVGSNNELTSQYSVRGGNYDENLVYINDFEIFRPYLVSNGQQEGLSFINPELVKNISFYTGGFQSKYGDKMSSVLDIQYRKPTSFSGSVYVSPLEQGLALSGTIKKDRATFVIGIRNKTNNNVLSNQPTTGSYLPSSSDLQSLVSVHITSKVQLELLAILSGSNFTFYPESVKKTSSVFSPFYTSNIGLDTYFEGQEKDSYRTGLLGASIIHQPNSKLKLKWMASVFRDKENENYDIAGTYLFGERDFDNTSGTFGEIVNPIGAGIYQQYARNELNISSFNAGHRGYWNHKKHFFQWGLNTEKTKINDELKQFEYQDSAGYSLPYQPGSLTIFNSLQSKADLDIMKYSGFVQDNLSITSPAAEWGLQYGIRINYNGLSKEFLVSPRAQVSLKPDWKKDMVFRFSGGIYHQPPFYREYRKPDGTVNRNILSQKSFQLVAGWDYQFKGIGDRPFRLSTEAYYKSMWDVIPYDQDNVRIRYFGANKAKAYAGGIEMRLFSELVKDAESWISISFMRTREDITGDDYKVYKNAAGEIIGPQTIDQIVTDSTSNEIGYLRRPTDRLITVGLYLQDYLATNKNFKAHVNMIYGSNMPYNIPGSSRYRNGLIIDPYIRVDLGFSALLLSDKKIRRFHSPFRKLENMWLSLEIFNIINKSNTISYQLIKDFSNTIYALPNQLTPRLLNLKLITRF